MIQQKIADFFESHPEANTVYVALGTLFVDFEKADKYVAGTGQAVDIVQRPGSEAQDASGEVETGEDVKDDQNEGMHLDDDKIEQLLDESLSTPPEKMPEFIDKNVKAAPKKTTGKKK